MNIRKLSAHVLTALPVLFLAGCGDGWEMVKYTGFPYGNERTAGSGVAYVRAHMMPQKGAELKPAMEEPKKEAEETPAPPPAEEAKPEPAPAPEKEKTEAVLNSAEKMFQEKMKK